MTPALWSRCSASLTHWPYLPPLWPPLPSLGDLTPTHSFSATHVPVTPKFSLAPNWPVPRLRCPAAYLRAPLDRKHLKPKASRRELVFQPPRPVPPSCQWLMSVHAVARARTFQGSLSREAQHPGQKLPLSLGPWPLSGCCLPAGKRAPSVHAVSSSRPSLLSSPGAQDPRRVSPHCAALVPRLTEASPTEPGQWSLVTSSYWSYCRGS